MNLIHKKFKSDSLDGSWVITIGNFDGFHLGHQALVDQVLKDKDRYQAKGGVLTFDPHPKKILQFKIPFRQIYDDESKWEFMQNAGLDACFVIPFTMKFAGITPMEFIEKLFNFANLKKIIVGYDFNFGKARQGTASLLKKEAEKKGIDFLQMSAIQKDNITVSSTMIRRLLFEGDFASVKKYLGRPWSVNGVIKEGNKLGHNLGFPTINIEPTVSLPLKKGVYACQLNLDGKIYNGVSNIGVKPTFGGDQLKVEMNIFNFNQDIYGKYVQVIPQKFIREEIKFNSVDELKHQIKKDAGVAKDYYKK
jgi:riboflavin kinase / FMN adenylyltransferase